MADGATSAGGLGRRRRDGLAGAALLLGVAAAAVLPYTNALRGGFVWDDHNLIVENHWITSARNLRDVFQNDFFDRIGDEVSYGYYRPLVTASYILDYALWGLDPHGYHLTNVLLHAASTVLGALVLLRLGLSTAEAAVGAGLFAVHPIHTENVAWISGRTDLVAFLFGAAALLLHLVAARVGEAGDPGPAEAATPPPDAGTRRDRRRQELRRRAAAPSAVADGPRPRVALHAASLGMLAAALLAKEMSVVVVAWIFLVHLLGPGGSLRRGLVAALPSAGVVAGYAVLRFAVVHVELAEAPPEHTLPRVLASMPSTVVRYLRLMVFPRSLDAYLVNPYVTTLLDPRPWVAALLLGLLAWAVWRRRRRAPLVLLLSAMTAASFAPIVNVVRISGPVDMGNVMAERFCYFPSFPCYALAGIAAAAALARYRAATSLALAAVAAWGSAATWTRNREWRDEITFFRRTLDQHPGTVLLLIRLAGAQIRANLLDDAGASLRRALAEAPDNDGVLSVLASWHVARREYAEAVPIQEKVVANVTMGRTRAINNLAFLYAATGREAEARAIWEDLRARGHGYAAIEYNLAEIYRKDGDLERAREGYAKALRERPQDRQYAVSLANVERTLGRHDAALQVYAGLLGLYPDDPRILNNVAAVQEEKGDLDAALEGYRRVVELDPAYDLARINYANVLRLRGRLAEAEVELRRVLARGADEHLVRVAAERLELLRREIAGGPGS